MSTIGTAYIVCVISGGVNGNKEAGKWTLASLAL